MAAVKRNFKEHLQSRLSRAVRNLAFAGSCLFAGAASAQVNPGLPSGVQITSYTDMKNLNDEMSRIMPETDVQDVHSDQVSATKNFHTRGITELRAEFSRTALGAELLSLADKNKTAIVYAPDLAAINGAGLYVRGEKGDTLFINDQIEMLRQVTTLAHEMRHLWHDKVMGYFRAEDAAISPDECWRLRRYMESDAEAFAAYFLADRMIRLDENIYPLSMLRETNVAFALKVEMAGDGLSSEEYRNIALMPCFERMEAYDVAVLSLVVNKLNNFGLDVLIAEMKSSKTVTEETLREIAGISSRLKASSDDEAMETFLRKFGGVSLDPAAATVLQDKAAVSRDDILYNYPQLDGAPITVSRQKLEEFRQVFEVLRLRANTLVEKTAAPAPQPKGM